VNEDSRFDLDTADEHPAFETLCAYHGGELTPQEDEAVREHLAGCAECTAVVLELTGLANDEGAEATDLSEMDVARAWRKVRGRLRDEGFVAPSLPRPTWGRTLALAAVVLLAISLPFFLRRESQVEVTLEPWNVSRGTGERPCTTLPAAAGWKLVLPVRDVPEPAAYRLEVRSEDAGPLLSRGAELGADGFVVEVSGDELPSGRYRLFLVREVEGGPAVLEQYCVRIGTAGPG